MAEVRLQKRTRSALSTEHKFAFVLLLFLGLGGVILGFLSFGANIRRPFDLQIANYQGELILTSEQRDAAELEAQKTRDSDGDGITDYDELAIFKTSPYLADTDSDGFDDKMEVFSGNDPNCPEGQTCKGFILNADAEGKSTLTPSDIVPPRSNPFPAVSGVSGIGNLNLQSPDDIENFFTGMSAADIRTLLMQQGIPKENLDRLTDEQLMELIQKSILEVQTSNF